MKNRILLYYVANIFLEVRTQKYISLYGYDNDCRKCTIIKHAIRVLHPKSIFKVQFQYGYEKRKLC